MTTQEAKLLIGKRVRWVYVTDPNRLNGRHWRYGIVTAVKYNNVYLENGDVQWLPQMTDLQERPAD